MKIRKIYNSVLESPELWDYYNINNKAPIVEDTDDCSRFIREFILYSEKSQTLLFKGVTYLENNSPQRLSHIVSTFFLGLWLFRNKRTNYIYKAIVEELKRLTCFQNRTFDIDREFTYVWFMATLFHDLGYKVEDKDIKTHIIDYDIVGNSAQDYSSVPFYYRKIYKNYYAYRKGKEHGIYAGLIFDRDICAIRRFQESYNCCSELNWRVELEELYHYVAWIIISHNIWMIRDNDNNVGQYKDNYLSDLILSSQKVDNSIDSSYKEYRIKFEEYPLFTLFCIVDTIEPIKNTSCLSDVDIRLRKDKIIIKSNDSFYRNKVKSLNKWLAPVYINNDELVIKLSNC